MAKSAGGTKAGAKENSENTDNEVRLLIYVSVVSSRCQGWPPYLTWKFNMATVNNKSMFLPVIENKSSAIHICQILVCC